MHATTLVAASTTLYPRSVILLLAPRLASPSSLPTTPLTRLVIRHSVVTTPTLARASRNGALGTQVPTTGQAFARLRATRLEKWNAQLITIVVGILMKMLAWKIFKNFIQYLEEIDSGLGEAVGSFEGLREKYVIATTGF